MADTVRIRIVKFYHLWEEAVVEVPLGENGEWSYDDVYDAADDAEFHEIERSYEDSYFESI